MTLSGRPRVGDFKGGLIHKYILDLKIPRNIPQ